jgi:predicted lysophospholipase L1 biosynthesis ABC-type transport system permease subunit
MREEGLDIGDELEITDAIAGTGSFRITGEAVLNVAGVDVSIPPGRGALFDWSVLALLGTEGAEAIAPSMFLVDVTPGRVAQVEEALTALFPTSTRAEAIEPLDLTNLGDASLLPSALGVVAAILGAGTVAHAMLGAVRRRRRELAVLKVVGFVRGDTRRAVAWQGLTFGVVALAVGLPTGVAVGRLAWAVAADQLGIPSHPVVTIASIVLVAIAFLTGLVLTAAVPAQLAGRIPAAEVLRRD